MCERRRQKSSVEVVHSHQVGSCSALKAAEHRNFRSDNSNALVLLITDSTNISHPKPVHKRCRIFTQCKPVSNSYGKPVGLPESLSTACAGPSGRRRAGRGSRWKPLERPSGPLLVFDRDRGTACCADLHAPVLTATRTLTCPPIACDGAAPPTCLRAGGALARPDGRGRQRSAPRCWIHHEPRFPPNRSCKNLHDPSEGPVRGDSFARIC